MIKNEFYLEKNAYYIRTNKPETRIATTEEIIKRINETQNDTQSFYIQKMIKVTENYFRFLGTLIDKDWVSKVYEREVESLEKLIKDAQKCEPYNAKSTEICEILPNNKTSWGVYIQENCDVFQTESKRIIDNIKSVQIINEIDDVINNTLINHAIKQKKKEDFSYILLLDYFGEVKKHALEVLSLLKYLLQIEDSVKINSMLIN